MENQIRAFIALEISREARVELSRIIDELKKVDAPVKWLNPQSIHLTLKFLGNISEEKIENISILLEKIAKGIASFSVTLGDIGVFPTWRRPRVIWLGIKDSQEKVKSMAGELEKALEKEGCEIEAREFKSHLTLGRVKTGKNSEKLKMAADADSVEIVPVSMIVDKIILYKSTLTPEGAEYTPLHVAKFTS